MKRIDALKVAYPHLEGCAVVTIMGAVAAELQSCGHKKNFFYLQHGMGLASSMGLGIALSRPELQVVVFDGDGSMLMNLGGLTTLARYRPANLVHVIFDNESLLSVGGFPTATSTGERRDRARSETRSQRLCHKAARFPSGPRPDSNAVRSEEIQGSPDVSACADEARSRCRC